MILFSKARTAFLLFALLPLFLGGCISAGNALQNYGLMPLRRPPINVDVPEEPTPEKKKDDSKEIQIYPDDPEALKEFIGLLNENNKIEPKKQIQREEDIELLRGLYRSSPKDAPTVLPGIMRKHLSKEAIKKWAGVTEEESATESAEESDSDLQLKAAPEPQKIVKKYESNEIKKKAPERLDITLASHERSIPEREREIVSAGYGRDREREYLEYPNSHHSSRDYDDPRENERHPFFSSDGYSGSNRERNSNSYGSEFVRPSKGYREDDYRRESHYMNESPNAMYFRQSSQAHFGANSMSVNGMMDAPDLQQGDEALIRAAIDALKSKINYAPGNPADEMRLRLLELCIGNQREAVRPIACLDESSRNFWSNGLLGMHWLMDETSLPDTRDRYSTAYYHISEAMKDLGKLCPLRIRNMQFISTCRAFGLYEPVKEEFEPGGTIRMYMELENLFIKRSQMSGYGIRVSWSVEIRNSNGDIIYQQNDNTAEDYRKSYVRDYHVWVSVDLPKMLPPGQYFAKVTIRDLNHPKQQESSDEIELRIKTSEN